MLSSSSSSTNSGCGKALDHEKSSGLTFEEAAHLVSSSSRSVHDSKAATPPLAHVPIARATASSSAATATVKAEITSEKIRFVDLSQWQKANLSTGKGTPPVKEITVDELKKMTGTQVQWSNTHIQAPDVKSLPNMMSAEDLKLYPPITKEKFDQIMAKVTESCKRLALADANPIHGFSTITTESIEPNELTLIYVGEYRKTSSTRKSYYNLVMSSDNETEIDATVHRGYLSYAMNAPLPSQLPAGVPGSILVGAYAMSEYKCKEAENDIVTVNMFSLASESFSFNGVPYVIFRNAVRIPAFHFLAITYGNQFFVAHDMLPRLCLKMGGSLLTEDNFQPFVIRFQDGTNGRPMFFEDIEALEAMLFELGKSEKEGILRISVGYNINMTPSKLKEIIIGIIDEAKQGKRKNFYTVALTDTFPGCSGDFLREDAGTNLDALSIDKEITQEIMQLAIDTHLKEIDIQGTDPGGFCLTLPPNLDEKAKNKTHQASAAYQGMLFGPVNATAAAANSTAPVSLPPSPQH
jgi:hypothetical protein